MQFILSQLYLNKPAEENYSHLVFYIYEFDKVGSNKKIHVS